MAAGAPQTHAGRVALVTGGGRGIGAAVARALAGLFEHRQDWNARRTRARAFVERERNWSSNIQRYQPVYQRLVTAAQSSKPWFRPDSA